MLVFMNVKTERYGNYIIIHKFTKYKAIFDLNGGIIVNKNVAVDLIFRKKIP